MISADVKANKTTRNERSVSEVPSKLEISCRKGIHFSFDFGWDSINLDILSVKNKGLGGAHLTDIIC